MTRPELEQTIRAACEVSGDAEVWVFGSQAILGEHPDAPESLRRSIEVDIAPRNFEERVDLIDGALGELSQFQATHGYYVHGVPITTASLPEGWETRTVAVSGKGARKATGWCVEGHDLAASKLVASRPKDRAFVRTLIKEGLVSPDEVISRIRGLTEDVETIERLIKWVRSTRSPDRRPT